MSGVAGCGSQNDGGTPSPPQDGTQPTPTDTLAPTDTLTPMDESESATIPSATISPTRTNTLEPTETDADTQQSTDTAGNLKIDPRDGDQQDFFGFSVAIENSTALIGAIRDEDPNGQDAGSAYVFERTSGGWTQQAILAPEDGDAGDRFGTSVALTNASALVSAYRDEDPNGQDSGSVYLFERANGEWTQQAKLVPEDGDSSDFFGRGMAVFENTALIGAYGDEDPNGAVAGSAYVFEI